jgi:hypothetical protein
VSIAAITPSIIHTALYRLGGIFRHICQGLCNQAGIAQDGSRAFCTFKAHSYVRKGHPLFENNLIYDAAQIGLFKNGCWHTRKSRKFINHFFKAAHLANNGLRAVIKNITIR